MSVMELPERIPLIIGASHNRSSKSRESLDHKVKEDAQRYRRRNLMSSDKILRSIHDDVDECKFNMPIYQHMTSVEFLLLSLSLAEFACFDTVTVGNKDTGRDVNHVRKFLRENYDISSLPKFRSEGNPASLDGTVRSGVDELGKPRKYGFITGDLVFPDRLNIVQSYRNFDPERYAVWCNLNAIDLIMPTPELKLFDRNCYAAIIQNGKRLPNKEPNLDFFSDRYQQWLAMNIAYRERAGGKLLQGKVFYELLANRQPDPDRQTYAAADMIAAIVRSAYHTLKNRQLTFRQEDADMLFSAILGNDVHFSAEHNDPWLIRDIDAYHDLLYFQLLSKEIQAHGGWKTIFEPRLAQAIDQYTQYLDQLPEETKQQQTLKFNFSEWFGTRIHQLEMKEYQGPRGVQIQPRPDEDLGKAVQQLQNRYNMQAQLLNAA